jgi:hypothetical protein
VAGFSIWKAAALTGRSGVRHVVAMPKYESLNTRLEDRYNNMLWQANTSFVVRNPSPFADADEQP